jgi:hypothetical protein
MEKAADTHGSRLRPSTPGRALLLGIAVLALLGLVAAASRAHRTPGGHPGGHRPPAAVGDYLFTIFAVVFVAGACAIVYLFFSRRNLLAQRHQSQWGVIRSLAFLMVFAAFAAIIMRVHGLKDVFHPRGATAPSGAAPVPTTTAAPVGAERAPKLEWLPVILAAGGALVVLAVLGVRSLARERRGLDAEFLLDQEFEELVDDTLADLLAETDPRRAIIAAYARVERLFASYGLPRDPAEAPLEYLDRVLPELRASGSALRRLTALFEWAKFSGHDVDRPMRDEAIAALVEVRDELRANRLEVAA